MYGGKIGGSLKVDADGNLQVKYEVNGHTYLNAVAAGRVPANRVAVQGAADCWG